MKAPAHLQAAIDARIAAILKAGTSSRIIYDMRSKARKGAQTQAKIIEQWACTAAMQLSEA